MARRLRLGVDVDGVLADFVSAFHLEAEAVLQRKFPPFFSDWGYSNWGLTKEEDKAIWRSVMNTPDWFLDKPKPLPTVPETLGEIAYWHDPFFITTRIETKGIPVQRQTQMWLDKNNVTYPTVLVSADKGPISAALQLDAFIDDKVENLERVQECSTSTRIFLMDATYNTDRKIPDNWTRVGTLASFLKHLRGEVR